MAQRNEMVGKFVSAISGLFSVNDTCLKISYRISE